MAGGGARHQFHVHQSSAADQIPLSQAASTPAEGRRGRVRHICTGGRLALPEAARDLVLEHCLREGGIQPLAGEAARATRVHLYAVVVMPDHVHLLFLPLRDEDGWQFPLVDILQCLKGTTAHRINRLLHTSGPVWEEESFDHVLRSDESLKEKCEYIRQNPVKAGLVQKPEDYR